MDEERWVFGSIEKPEKNQVLSGIVQVAGWLLTTSQEELRILIQVDDKPIDAKIYRYPRPDVTRSHPELSSLNPNPGFTATLSTFNFSDGEHTITCIAETIDKSTVVSSLDVSIENNDKPKIYHQALHYLYDHLQQLLFSYQELRNHIHDLNDQVLSLTDRITRMEIQSYPEEELWDRTRKRWRSSKPQYGLTCGMKLSGEDFITKAESYGLFNPDRIILEIGPGYGRLLKACLDKGIPFKEYVGVDISARNIEYLTKTFSARGDLQFIQEDVEKVSLNRNVDVVISSLTLKHLYPTFENALQNIYQYMNSGGTLFVDFVEGESVYIREERLYTYVRQYTRSEIKEILNRLNLHLIAFDEVEHAPGFERLLVIANKA